MSVVMLASASIDERGRAHGGKAGDQNGKEVKKQPWYLHPKGWVVYRPIDPIAAEIIAETAEDIAENNHIGYDQWQRNTAAKVGKENGWNADEIEKDVELDCSKAVQFELFAAGIDTGDWNDNFRTANMGSRMMATGKFKKLTGTNYTRTSVNLKRGDILVTAKTPGHTVTVITDGANIARKLGDRPFTNGTEGVDVELFQSYLKTLGYDLGRWGEKKNGIDGEYGGDTAAAVKAFQKAHGLAATGKADLETISAVIEAIKTGQPPVVIEEPDESGDDERDDNPDPDESVNPSDPTKTPEPIPDYKCPWVVATAKLNVRTGPGTNNSKKISLYPGTSLMYDGETRNGWYAVLYRGKRHWVSSKYSKIEVLEKYVVDMSVYDEVEDWATFFKYISFGWLRVACRRNKSTGEVYIDGNFKKYAAKFREYGVPFGVYVYGRAKTKAGGAEEAQKAVKWAEPYEPTVYMYDIEAPTLTQISCQAFIDEAERLTGKPCGIYVGRHWSQVNAGSLRRAYTMCPYYRNNGGGTHGDRNPSHPHDVHQYTCSCIIPGKKDPGDCSHINADPKTNGTGRTIEWFRSGGKAA